MQGRSREPRCAGGDLLLVWYRASARNQVPLARHNNDIIVLWGEEDPASEVYIYAVYCLARALVVPKPAIDHLIRTQKRQVEGAFDQIWGLATILDKVKESGEDVVKKGQEVVALTPTVEGQLEAQVAALRALTVTQHPDNAITSSSPSPVESFMG